MRFNPLFFLFVIIGLAFLPKDALSKEKIIDKSGKKPKWVKAEQPNLIRIQVKSQTLFEAKQKAINQFEKSLNVAVVRRLNAKSDSLKKVRISNFIYQYQWATIKGASFEKIIGIHDSLVTDIYWEKHKLSRGGYLFNYHVLFNCSSAEIEKISKQFDNLDTRITSRLEPIKRKMAGNNPISWMFGAKDSLFSILEVAPPNYHGNILTMIEQIQEKLDLVEIKILQKEKSTIKFQAEINGSIIPFEHKPKVSSTCAKVKTTNSNNNSCIIEFDSRYCLKQDPESGFTVDLGTGNHVLRRTILLF